MLSVNDKVKIKSFILVSKENPTGEDVGVVKHIEKAFIKMPFMPSVQVELERGDSDGHKMIRFTFEEVTKI
ncbi:hypothetical protein [Bacillus phage Anath]|uniref:Uncharacterized protein n=1 Tax=Bacillus phage Anath TaxID=2108114 RepID=A0A2P1JUP0_9CAUD|nr:hypothetical protein [Bacillus phage Anath]